MVQEEEANTTTARCPDQDQINTIQKQPIQDQDHSLEAKLIAQYEENMTKLTEFYSNEQRNTRRCTETGTPHIFTMMCSSVDIETTSFQLRKHMATTSLTQTTLLMNLYIILKQSFTALVLTMAGHTWIILVHMMHMILPILFRQEGDLGDPQNNQETFISRTWIRCRLVHLGLELDWRFCG